MSSIAWSIHYGTARQQKMTDVGNVRDEDGIISGFDPDHVSAFKRYTCHTDGFEISPMGYFSQHGDLPMVRWLYAIMGRPGM